MLQRGDVFPFHLNIALLYLLWALFIVLPLQAQNTEVSPRVRVGVLLPLSGSHAELGQGLLMGVEFAARHAPAQVQALYQDVRCDPAVALAAAERMRREEGVDVFLGPVCPEAIATVVEYAEQERVPVLSLLHAPLQLTNLQQSYAFAYDWRRERSLILAYIKKKKYTKVAFIGVENSMEDPLLKKRIEDSVKSVQTITLNEGSFRRLPETLREIVAHSPDVIVLSSAAQWRYDSLASQLARLTIPLLLQGGMQVSLASANAAVFTRPKLDRQDPELLGLAEHVQKYFRADAASLALAYLGYAAFDYLAQSMKDSIDVHEALRLSTYRHSTALDIKRFAEGRVFLVQPELVVKEPLVP